MADMGSLSHATPHISSSSSGPSTRMNSYKKTLNHLGKHVVKCEKLGGWDIVILLAKTSVAIHDAITAHADDWL